MNNKAKELEAKTQDAYSASRYGSQWVNCAELLLTARFSEAEAEEVLRSKIMRYSADGATRQTKHAYFMAFAADLAREYVEIKENAVQWVAEFNVKLKG